MGRKYYTEYARHCIRFYLNYPELSDFKNQADKLDYNAAWCVLNRKEHQTDLQMYKTIYFNRDTFEDTVNLFSIKEEIPQKEIWRKTSKLEYEVAKARGLK